MKILITMIIGIVIGWCVASTVYNPYETTNSRLIDSWRLVKMGMTTTDVESLLGDSAYIYKAGEGWPAYAAERIPRDLSNACEVRVYYVKGIGPHLLLVLFDPEGKVAFVTSSST